MKKTILIFLLSIAIQCFAQNYPITGITISLPASPDANTANWGTGTSMLTITASTKAENGKVTSNVIESKILVTIKKGGSKVCGDFNSNTAPSAGFNTMTKAWASINAASLIGKGCILAPGDYELCVQFFGSSPKIGALSEEKCKTFTIRGNEQQTYQPPQAIMPADGTVLKEQELKKPITFRWIPVMPKPKEPVTYHLKVWQLMEGQTWVQAMKSNPPLVVKDVENMNQTVITELMSVSFKKPYLCSFIWNVQALNKEGKGVGNNNGTSGSNQFTVKNVGVVPTFHWTCESYGVYNFTLNVVNNGSVDFYTHDIVFNPSVTISTPINPAVPGTIIPPGSSVNFSGTFHYNGAYPVLCHVTINGYEPGDPFNIGQGSDKDTLKACLCNDCDSAIIHFTDTTSTPAAGNNGQFNLAGNINVSGLPSVYGIEFQILSYNYSPNPAACSNGVTSIANSGMFIIPGTTINNSSSIQVFNETISGSNSSNNGASKDIKYVSATPLGGNIHYNLLIGLPAPLPGLATNCCTITYNVCIGVKVYYDRSSCKSCLFTKCFQFSNQ